MLLKNTSLAIAKILVVLFALGHSIYEARADNLAPEIESLLQATLDQDPLGIDDWPLYQATLIKHEALEPLLERLDDLIEADDENFSVLWLAASLHWRYGNLDDARELFEQASESNAHPLVLFRVGQLLDASGKADEAAEQYLKAIEAKPDDKLAERIRLRLALLKTTGSKLEALETDLATFAADRDPKFQNRAAIILALANKPKEALELYKPAEEGNDRFKQQIRIAGWAMASKDFAKGQAAAWEALMSAKLKRDRRYALTVLAESYRRAEALDDLIDLFSAEPDLPEEARDAWIDLLRERGDSEEALALFETAKSEALADGTNAFTPGMRRELLEICREAGRDDLLVENFHKMIAEEPRRLEWRSGLCRFYLESGDRAKGLEVWADFRENAPASQLLAAAGATGDLGLDPLAISFAEEIVSSGTPKEKLAALQFTFDLHKSRGNEDGQIAVLARMGEIAAPDASERAAIAEAWEQVGRQDKAAEVLEKLRAARGPENFSSDLETRLAWLYSEVGEEEKAYESWKSVWLRIESPGRRRYIEDRLMATASRLGKLANIAIGLEEKLAEGKADKRDSGLLVRLYTKVGDPVSASEIVQEFMKQSGGSEIAMLEEQARIYVMCNDYYHYEKTIRRLMELDPEGMPEYYTQLAMSALERGRNDQAQAILTEMRELEQNSASAEFEAGVLKIAGMHREAAAAYWRGVAENPNRIDTYLLLGRAMQTLGKGKQALGIFQYLVENADKDDLFTIAIDGLLNMNNPRQGSRLEPATMQWARRTILERLAGRDDKLYLFQLLADMSGELRDQPMMMRALAETLPIAGERRTSQLRELMELARTGLGGSGVSRGNAKPKSKEDMLNYGRRLIGIGEAIPPQVYLDLGSSFLDEGDVRNAGTTFDKANENSNYGGYQRKIASTFEGKGYLKSALREYEKLLLGEFSDAGLVLKVGELKEQLGRYEEAASFYRRTLELLLDGQSLFNVKQKNAGSSKQYYYSRNIGDFDKYYDRALIGFLATADSDEEYPGLIGDYKESLASDLKRAVAESKDVEGIGEKDLSLAIVPRIARRSELLFRITLSQGDLENARALSEFLLNSLPHDETLLPTICSKWNAWGYTRRAQEMVETFQENPGYATAAKSVGQKSEPSGGDEIFRKILNGDDDGARALLQDIDRLLSRSPGTSDSYILFSAARYLKDSAAIERLATRAINRAPQASKLYTSIAILTRSFPRMDKIHQERLAAYVSRTLGQQSDIGSSAYYYLSRLKQFTGNSFTLPLETVKPQVEQMLARGGYYVRQIAPMMSTLGKEDFRTLLPKVYRDAKSSDRAAIIFGLVAQYPHKMDTELEQTFMELVEAATGEPTADLLKLYQSYARNQYPTGMGDKSPNLDFRAKVLEMIAAGQPKESRSEWIVLQQQALQQAGDTGRVLELAKREFKKSLQNEDKIDSRLLHASLGEHIDTFLAMIDQYVEAEGESLHLERRRHGLIRLTGDPERTLTALQRGVEKYPEEKSFRIELCQHLAKLGRPFDTIKVLEALAELEPDEDQHRANLEKAWTALDHPIQAAGYNKATETTAPPTKEDGASQPPSPAKAPAKPATKTTESGHSKSPAETKSGQEQKVDTATAQLIKNYYDAKQLDEAQSALRRLWRQFPNLNQTSRNRYLLNRPPDGKLFIWQAGKPTAASRKASASSTFNEGGLKAFLQRPLSPAQMPHHASKQPEHTSIFEAVGGEEFASEEISRWLQTLTPQQYQGQAFEEMLIAVATRIVAADGAEEIVTRLLDADAKGELGKMDQRLLLAILELYPDAGGASATSYLDHQMGSLNPTDVWKSLHLARCLSKRGNTERALPLYRWCGANVDHATYNNHGNVLSGTRLVQEIGENLEGETRLRALDTVLGLMTPNRPDTRSLAYFRSFVLTTWNRELPSEDVYRHCSEICDQIIEEYQPTQDRTLRSTLELATLFLASGGNTRLALDGFEYIMLPEQSYTSSSSQSNRLNIHLLQRFLPEEIKEWANPRQWLSGITERVSQWMENDSLPVSTATKLLSLVALRQHQNGFADDVATTLTELHHLSPFITDDALWLSDAARMTGNRPLAIEMESNLLREHRLPISRVASLMKEIAETDGPEIANGLAESAFVYTCEREFLKIMIEIASAAEDPVTAELWSERHRKVLALDPNP